MDQRGRKFVPAHRRSGFTATTHRAGFPAVPRRVMIPRGTRFLRPFNGRDQ